MTPSSMKDRRDEIETGCQARINRLKKANVWRAEDEDEDEDEDEISGNVFESTWLWVRTELLSVVFTRLLTRLACYQVV